MKNSLFKRAVATVAAVPLALTQSLTCSFAAADVSVPVSVAATEDTSTSFTLQSLLHIAPDDDDQSSDWNYTVSNAIDKLIAEGKTTGSINPASIFNIVASNAGQYKEIAEHVIATVSESKYEIDDEGNIILTAKVGNISAALNEVFKNSFGELNEKLANKYNAPELKNIDYTQVKASGSVKIVIGSSELGARTKVPVTFGFTPDETGNELGAAESIEYIYNKIQEYKNVAFAAIDAATSDFDKEAAKKDAESKISNYERLTNFLSRNLKRVLTETKSGKYDNVAELIARLNKTNFLQRHNKQIPENGAAIASSEKVQKLYNKAKNFFNKNAAPYTLDIEASELGAFADSFYGIETESAKGKASFVANFPEDEFEALDAYYAELGEEVDHENTYKQVIVKVDASEIDGNSFTVDVKIKRNLVTKPIETTTTTTESTTESTTETEETTTESTTESTTETEETTTESTTESTTETEVTESTTSETETVVTESSTTVTDTETSSSTVTETETVTETDTETSSSTVTETETETESTTSTTETEVTESTTSETDTETDSSTTVTETTSETTDVTTETVTETEPVVTLALVGTPYVNNEGDADKSGFVAKYGFYTQIDKAFSFNQVEKLELTIMYKQDIVDTDGKVKTVSKKTAIDISDKFNYGEATPANTFDLTKAQKSQFEYKLAIYAAEDIYAPAELGGELILAKGTKLTNDFDEDILVSAYIGVKGDADLNGKITADDASLALRFYTQLSKPDADSTAVQLSSNKIAMTKGEGEEYSDNPNGLYDNFAAFLIDTYTDYADAISAEDNWRVGKKDMFAGTNSRKYDATDASYILRYYTWASGQGDKELTIADQADGWAHSTGKAAE